MQCEYQFNGWRRCPKQCTHVHVTVKSTMSGGTVTRYQRVCAEHSKAADLTIYEWMRQRMADNHGQAPEFVPVKSQRNL